MEHIHGNGCGWLQQMAPDPWQLVWVATADGIISTAMGAGGCSRLHQTQGNGHGWLQQPQAQLVWVATTDATRVGRKGWIVPQALYTHNTLSV